MGGIASLFGGNSAKTDRKQQLDARDNVRNVFNYALPAAQTGQATGTGTTADAGKIFRDSGEFFQNLLKSNRSDTAQQAAPAINANLDAADAIKRREAITGTGRTGGTAELDRMAASDTSGKNADIVNQTLNTNKAIGSSGELQAGQGLASVGSEQLRNSLQMLGLSESAISTLLGDTTKSRVDSQNLHNSPYDRVASDVGSAIAAFI
jgi:hypothetical protein